MLRYSMLYTIPYNTILYSDVLYCTLLSCTSLVLFTPELCFLFLTVTTVSSLHIFIANLTFSHDTNFILPLNCTLYFKYPRHTFDEHLS